MTAAGPRSLVVAVLTFRRPEDLSAVLPLLVTQVEGIADLIPDAHLLVVDNDPDAGARAAVDAFARTVPTAIRYANEVAPGIAAARNRALDESSEIDLLVFIDDDERPTEHWLRLLLSTFSDETPAAVVGPVVSRFALPPDPFIVAGQFFERRRLATGTEVDVAATNNLLIDLREVRDWDLRFDEASGISGGEDTLFTRSMRARGGRIIWCDEAVVLDVVPPARTTRRWVLLRALSSGNSWGLTSLQLTDGLLNRLGCRFRLHVSGLIRVAGGIAQTAVGTALARDTHRARGLRTAARGAGMVLGAWSIRYREYRRR